MSQAVNLHESDYNVDNEYEISPLSPVQKTNEINIQCTRINLTFDWFHHLIKLWGKAVSKNVHKHVRVYLAGYLKEIDCHLGAKVDMGSIIRTMHKVLNLECDLLKGDGDSFKSFVE